VALQTCVEAFPDHVLALQELSHCEVHLGLYRQALAHRRLLSCLEGGITPGNSLALAIAAYINGEINEAIETVAQLRRLDPTPSVPCGWTSAHRFGEITHFHAVVLEKAAKAESHIPEQATKRVREALDVLREHPRFGKDESILVLEGRLSSLVPCPGGGCIQAQARCIEIYTTLTHNHPGNLDYHKALRVALHQQHGEVNGDEILLQTIYEPRLLQAGAQDSLRAILGAGSTVEAAADREGDIIPMPARPVLRAALEVLPEGRARRLLSIYLRDGLCRGITSTAIWGDVGPFSQGPKASMLWGCLQTLLAEATEGVVEINPAEKGHRALLSVSMCLRCRPDSLLASWEAADRLVQACCTEPGEGELKAAYAELCLQGERPQEALCVCELAAMATMCHNHGTRRNRNKVVGRREDNALLTRSRLAMGRIEEAKQGVVLYDEDDSVVRDPRYSQAVWFEATCGVASLEAGEYGGMELLEAMLDHAQANRRGLYSFHRDVLECGSVVEYLAALEKPYGIDAEAHISAARAVIRCCVKEGGLPLAAAEEWVMGKLTRQAMGTLKGFLLCPKATCMAWGLSLERWLPRNREGLLLAAEAHRHATQEASPSGGRGAVVDQPGSSEVN